MKTRLRKIIYFSLGAIIVLIVMAVLITPPASYELSETQVQNPLLKR